MKLYDCTDVIRSKNSGPFELTFDIMFKTKELFEDFRDSNIMTKKVFADLYNIKESDILGIIAFAPAKAIKITIKRPLASGNLGECDVYGAQQHAPLMAFTW